MDFFKKIQNLPEFQRKIVFWIILALVAIIAFSFWVARAKQKLKSFGEKEFFEKIEPFPRETEGFQTEDLEENLEMFKEAKEIMDKIEQEEISPEDLEDLKEIMLE